MKDVERVKLRVHNTGPALIDLLDWACFRSTSIVLDVLLSDQPKADAMLPPASDSERLAVIREMNSWVSRVYSETTNANYNGEIRRSIGTGEWQAQAAVRELPVEQRPQGIDVLPFSDYYVAVRQCEFVGEYLKWVIKDIGRLERTMLDKLRPDLAVQKEMRT